MSATAITSVSEMDVAAIRKSKHHLGVGAMKSVQLDSESVESMCESSPVSDKPF